MIKKIFNRYIKRLLGNKAFPGSQNYWETRYVVGDTSGDGSYGKLADFKAEVLNKFVQDNKIKSVIEFGCGDGNQLALFKMPQYTGIDVSETAIKMCKDKMKGDKTKEFFVYNNKNLPKAELGLSLDVIYHLIEDETFVKYMNDILNSSSKYAIFYASNKSSKQKYHVKHREFVEWIKTNRLDWKLIKKIDNKYPKLSFADFYIFERIK